MILDRLSAPILLAPLGGGPSTPELAAAVSDAGGLGFVAAAYLTPDDLAERLRRTRELTNAPFGVNVFAPGTGPADPASYGAYVQRLRDWATARELPVGEPRFDDDHFAAKVELLLGRPPEVVSFTFGCPDAEVIRSFQGARAEVWVTVTHPDEARQAARSGADALVAQGAEAGGHRGSFTDRPDLPVLGLLPLLDLVQRAVDLPIIASGGIATGRSMAAALAAGARAVQLGTAFMLAPEAGTAPAHRQALKRPGETALTRAFTGRLARGIRNRFMTEHDHEAPIAYPEIHHVTAPLRRQARAAGEAEAINLWAGEAHELARELPAQEIVRQLLAEARQSGASLPARP